MELLKVENLTFTYPKQNPDAAEPEPTLQNVSFQVQEGAFVVVCGESGCGNADGRRGDSKSRFGRMEVSDRDL